MAQKRRPAVTEICCQVGRAAAFRLYGEQSTETSVFSYKTQSYSWLYLEAWSSWKWGYCLLCLRWERHVFPSHLISTSWCEFNQSCQKKRQWAPAPWDKLLTQRLRMVDRHTSRHEDCWKMVGNADALPRQSDFSVVRKIVSGLFQYFYSSTEHHQLSFLVDLYV